MRNYSIIFTVGRMNPPTPGHFYLIEKMLEEALGNDVKKIHIILSSKTDSKKNPLEPEEKRYILETYGVPYAKRSLARNYPDFKTEIDEIAVDILLTHEHNKYFQNDIMTSVKHVLCQRRKGERVLFVGGDEFPLNRSIDRVLLDRTENPISGTIVRTIAQLSFYPFAAIYAPFGICQRELRIMYEAINELELSDKKREAIAYMRARYPLRRG